MHARPPFDAAKARRLRESLGMTPAHVSYGMWAAFGLRITPETIAAWELQEETPNETELAALAGALWCSPADLLGKPRTLHEYRLVKGVALSDVALQIGMPTAQYAEVERTGTWTGNEQQAATLAAILGLSVRTHIELIGKDRKLREHLRSAAGSRWQAYVRPVHKLLPSLDRPTVERVLERLNDEFHKRSFSSLSWIDTSTETGSNSVDAGRQFLDEVGEHFWAQLEALHPGR
ncbi:helix-turn-helix transcriptional regulator [Streptomyces sp. JJ38]|uniref:helix-turn-helix domain-containing protein n=1 Tax=Streptomyces sp. JJ38 TaxID=2738128 RepID=UPI001C56D930|nr:helix-turn-helix transcriptional regulator [Streptomyces sp. JJ38]MBW1595860.1 helix-turn-helix transcriptional regulator [Streptomyces sp. JJ38]